MSGDLSIQTPRQAAAKSQAYVLPHSSGNPRRYLLLAQVLRWQNRNSPCPSSPLGPLHKRGLRNPCNNLNTRRLCLPPGTTQLASLGCLF